MEDSQDEYRIIEDDRERVQVAPRCSVVKISCGFIPKGPEPVREEEDQSVGRGITKLKCLQEPSCSFPA